MITYVSTLLRLIYHDYDEHKPTPLMFVSTDNPTVNESQSCLPLYRREEISNRLRLQMEESRAGIQKTTGPAAAAAASG